MSRHVFKMPDLGEGTVAAEIVDWKVKVGDQVKEDQILAEVMTDKAAVEIPAPVSGRVVAITGQPGDMVAVGSELIAFDTSGAPPAVAPAAPAQLSAPAEPEPKAPPVSGAARSRVMASPATRRKAHVAGVDLATVNGTGPGGRISAQDIESIIAGKSGAMARPAARTARSGTQEIKVIGVRRVIAERLSAAKRNIPHFAYVEPSARCSSIRSCATCCPNPISRSSTSCRTSASPTACCFYPSRRGTWRWMPSFRSRLISA